MCFQNDGFIQLLTNFSGLSKVFDFGYFSEKKFEEPQEPQQSPSSFSSCFCSTQKGSHKNSSEKMTGGAEGDPLLDVLKWIQNDIGMLFSIYSE